MQKSIEKEHLKIVQEIEEKHKEEVARLESEMERVQQQHEEEKQNREEKHNKELTDLRHQLRIASEELEASYADKIMAIDDLNKEHAEVLQAVKETQAVETQQFRDDCASRWEAEIKV